MVNASFFSPQSSLEQFYTFEIPKVTRTLLPPLSVSQIERDLE